MQFIRQVLDRVGDKWSLLARAAYVEAPPRVEYSLTPLGRGLHEIVTSLNGWAAEHHNETCENRARATTN